MPKQLNVNLAFTADTSQAKRELQALQQELKKLAVDSLGDSSLGKYTKELQVARDAAVDLRNKLAEATDVNTGKLDLSKFSQSLKNGGMDLKDYQAQLANLGPAGDKAFASVANAILKAELPLKRTSGLLEQFKITLMNTARWQISSNILHGFQGALQTAWHYAQDLNESLNNIQIVTQQSNEQMAQFAINANKAAHELSASTTTYTDAALIYYQQGLNDEQVKQRTDVTVKLANVTGDSASKVSEQMTAIWNNFDDGTQSLEHYADVLTALGAATASSSDEIAGGMQQFAASASTVGLSYEYAASALATVVASTRQSENIVGNAFKTLFARLEGLNLGETLDDGTTLNKYSAALDKVGISIKDQYGNMKAMDDILDELGAKWGTLAKDQQVALAQTVGGVRQYTQLIALMDNWDEFQKNLSIANKSDGSLQEQADIYADSWQAAQKRVQNSLEEIYHDLIDDKAFIKVLDFIDNIIQGVDAIIKGVGGLKGVLSGVGALLLNVFGKELTQGLNNLAYNFNIKSIQDEAIKQKQEAAQAMSTYGANNADAIVGNATQIAYQEQGKLQQQYLEVYSRLTEEQRKQVQLALDLKEAEGARLIDLAKEISAEEQKTNILQRQLALKMSNSKDTNLSSRDVNEFADVNKDVGSFTQQFINLKTALENGTMSTKDFKANVKLLLEDVQDFQKEKIESSEIISPEVEKDVNDLIQSMQQLLQLRATKFKDGSSAQQEYFSATNKVEGAFQGLSESTANSTQFFGNWMLATEKQNNELTDLGVTIQGTAANTTNFNNTLDGFQKGMDQTREATSKMQEPLKTTNELIVASAQGVSTFIFALQSISGIIDTINSKDMSDGEKVVAVIGSLAMLIPTIMRSYQGLNTVIAQYNARQTAQAALAAATTAAEKKKAEAMLEANTAAAAFNPVLAGIMVAVGAIVLVYKLWTAHLEKHREEVQKHIDQQQEEINKKKELINSNTELVASLTKLENKYDSVGNATSEYISQLSKLIDTYDIEDGRLKLLQKDYAGAEKAVYSKIKADKEAAIANAESANRYLQENNFNEDTGLFGSYLSEKSYNTSDNTFWEKLGHAAANANVSQNGPNLQAQQAIDDSYKNDWNNLKGSTQATQDAIDTLHELNFINEQGANFSQVAVNNYSKVAEALTTLKQAGVSMAEDPLNDLNTFMASDNYKTFIENAKLIHSEKLSSAFIDPADTKNLTDFSGAVHNLLQDVQENYSLAEIISAASEAGNQWADDYMALSEKFGDALDDNILKKYQSMSKEQRTLFLLADIDPKSLAQTDQAVADYIKSHKADTLQIKLELITEAADNWKEDMSAGEINAWYEQYKDLFASEAEWREFLFKDFSDQQDWLGERITETKPEVVKAINDEIAAMRERAAEMAINGGGLTDDAQAAKKTAAQLEEEKLFEEHNGSRERAAEIQAQLNELYAKYPEILAANGQALSELNQKIAENEALNRTEMDLLAASAESFEQLEEWLQNGTIDAKAFNSGLEKLYNQLDEDVDKEEWEDLSKFLQKNAKELKGVSAELTTNERAAKKVASAILRFDDAIQDVSEHYDDWMHALKKGTAQDQAKAASEMADAYADLLDLPFDTLSGQFLQNANNLELMKAAAEGNEDAYKQLQAAVQEDIAVQAHFDTTEFNNGFNDLMNQYYQGQSLDDIEVGASLDNAGFLAGLTQMINAAGMTAEQATNYLASMGVDAIVREKEPEMTSVTSTASVWEPAEYTEGSVPFGDRQFYYPRLSGGGVWRQVSTTHMEEASPAAASLEVVSANKSSGGGFKFENASHGGGGGGSKGGGGGGGSAPKHQTVDRAAKKPPQKVEDRYHVINNQIEDLAKQYDRLSEAEERAFGKSKLALMDRQVEILKEQYEAQRKLRKEAEKYWAEDLANLKSASYDADGDGEVDTLGIEEYLKDNPIFLKLDENGTILNYDELIDAANNRYNSFIAQYNAFIDGYNSLTAEQQESEKEKFEAEKEQWDKRLKNEDKYYENFLGLIDQYEETQDKVQEEFNKEIEQYHAMLDKLLEKTEYQVKLRLDIDDDALKVIDFLMKTVADDALDAAQKIDLIGQQTALTLDKIKAETAGISGIFSNHFGEDHVFDTTSAGLTENNFVKAMQAAGYTKAVNGDATKLQLDTDKLINDLQTGKTSLQNVLGSMEGEFTEEEIEKFREHVSNILDDTADLWQQRKDLFEAASEQIEASNDRLEKMADQIDHLNEVTGKYKDIMDILGHNGYYGITTKQITELAEAQHQMYVDSVAAAKARNDFAQNTLKTLIDEQKAYAEGTDMYNYYQGLIDEAQETANQTEQELMSDLEEALQHVRDTFDQTMELMAADASKILGGAMGSLEGLANIMDQYEKTHDTFVDGYEQVYRLNKLNAEAAKAIDETNNPKAKKELMKYQQEVLDQMRAYQEDGAQMSEWELQNLEKKLALRQAELALEEARNIKSQVRMQRDNEGNYSYVYTADEDNVADAEANYRDKLYEMQKANAEYIQQLQNDIVSLQQDALQQIAHAQETYGYGTEEYFKAVNQIETWYNEAVQDKYNQLELVMGANRDLQQFDLEFHSRITGDMMLKDQDYVTNFEQTVLSQQTGFATSQQAASVWNEALTGLMKGVEEETNLYRERNEDAMNAAGQTLERNKEDYKNWGETAHNQASQAIKDSEELKDKIEEYAKTFDEQINGKEGILADIKNWADTWSKIVDEMVKKNEGLANSMGEVIKKLSGIGEEIQKVKDAQPMKITVEQENTGNNDGTTAASVPVSVGGNGSSGGGAGGTGSDYSGSPTGQPITGTGQYKYTSNNDGKTHTTSEKMSDDSWKVIDSRVSCKWTMTGPTSGYCLKCGQSYRSTAPKQSNVISTKQKYYALGVNDPDTHLATGGYTGDWGSTEGKLAVLHEKELVLNKEDTTNMLAAVGMIRQISNVIDLNAKTAGGAFSQLIAAGVSTGAQELQQEVHITAEFPNATDKNEILEAFDNVINLASMYANRKV